MVNSDPISKTTMNQENKMLFASLVTIEVNPQLSHGHSISHTLPTTCHLTSFVHLWNYYMSCRRDEGAPEEEEEW